MSKNWIILCILAAPAVIQAQAARGTASATIVRPLNIEPVDHMDFGGMIPPGPGFHSVANRSVTLGSDRSLIPGASVRHIGTPHNPASFRVTGAPRAHFRLLPIEDFEVQILGTEHRMNVRVTDWRDSTAADTAGLDNHLTLDDSGRCVFVLESTLEVGTEQAPGVYRGTYNVTVVNH